MSWPITDLQSTFWNRRPRQNITLFLQYYICCHFLLYLPWCDSDWQLVTAAFTPVHFWLTQCVNAVVYIILVFLKGTLTQRVELYNHNIPAFHCPDSPLLINEVKTWWTLSMNGAHIASAYRQGQRDWLTVAPRDNPERKLNGTAKIVLLMPGRVFCTNAMGLLIRVNGDVIRLCHQAKQLFKPLGRLH